MEIKINGFNIFGREIPFYGLLFVLGFTVAVATAIPKLRRMGLPFTELACSAVFAGIGGILGAKLLSVFTSIKFIIEYHISFLEIIQNGFVFYGGLIGGALGLFVYGRVFHEPILRYFDLFAAGTALGHSFGRVGCLFSGCCYGIPTTGNFYVIYRSAIDPNTPLDLRLLPIQLIESFCLIAIYALCEVAFYCRTKRGISAAIYVFCYTVTRFVLEFFRGDLVRGLLGGLSTSQYISIAIFVFCSAVVAHFVIRRWRKRGTHSEEK